MPYGSVFLVMTPRRLKDFVLWQTAITLAEVSEEIKEFSWIKIF
jgi:hypothetical protein